MRWVSIIFIPFCIESFDFSHQTDFSETTPRQCREMKAKRTDKQYWLEVIHGAPRTLNDRPGSVFINATIIGGHRATYECSWALNVNGVIVLPGCTNISETYFTPWYFKEPGLKVVTVTAMFSFDIYPDKKHTIQNCTTVNVTECTVKVQLAVSTTTQAFNASKNESKLVLNSPGWVNFTSSLLDFIDSFHICHPLAYNWNFGDGIKLDMTYEKHTSHHYNKSGTYNMSLGLYGQSRSLENISITVVVKETKHNKGQSHDTAIDVSLVLAICVAGVVLITFFVLMRKRVKKFTEVASFDFRHKDFLSDNGRVFLNSGFTRKFRNRQGDRERSFLLQSDTNKSFGSMSPHEDL